MPYTIETPHFLVVIATRNRGSLITATIKSVLENVYLNFHICVVDQSDKDFTQLAVQPFRNNNNFTYIRSSTRGCSSARNVGISQFAREFIAITDDDCIVPPNWLSEMNKAFSLHPNIGVVGGNTIAGEYDQSAGFIPTYFRKTPFFATTPQKVNRVRAICACYGIRYDVWKNVGYFDELLGTGASFRSSSEGDFTVKTLLAGYYVYETPHVYVIHNGFRTWQEGRALARRNYYGLGAVDAKYLKQKRWFALKSMSYVFGYKIVGSFLKNLFFYRKISGLTPILSYWKGFIAGLLTPINPVTGNYLKINKVKTNPITCKISQ